MNQYPTWKYLLIVAILLVGGFYAAPNIYGDDPAIQIAATAGGEINTQTLAAVETSLNENKIEYKSTLLKDSRILIRFFDTDSQTTALNILKEMLGLQYIVRNNYLPNSPKWLSDLNAQPMYLGLDLRGGLHLLLEVDMEQVMKNELARYKDQIFTYTSKNREKKIRPNTMKVNGEALELIYKSEAKRDEMKNIIRSIIPELLLSTTESEGAFYIVAQIRPERVKEHRSEILSQIIGVLKKRIDDKYQGLMEPIIVRSGDNRIVAEFPGVANSEEIINVILSRAQLEFRMEQKSGAGGRTYTMREEGRPPVLLKNKIIITGDEITHATATSDQNGQPAVSVRLNSVGADKMYNNTKKYLGERMGVVFIEFEDVLIERDGVKQIIQKPNKEVISLATIEGVFSERFQITGLSRTESSELALFLRSGALAAPIKIVTDSRVGPSMGQDRIDSGIMSVVVGFLLVVTLILVWYRSFGLLANTALLVNLILIVGVLSMFQATLTLPGIAGIVLTVGMAVDANVLIFERIREEVAIGNTPQASIKAGYEKAFSTIADANITTLIAAIVLFMFGTGPIKGFATTLSIGIATSMFTSIMGTRAILNLIVSGRKIKKLSI